MNISPRCAEWLARISMAFVIYAILAVSFSCPLNSWAFVLCQISVYLLAGVISLLISYCVGLCDEPSGSSARKITVWTWLLVFLSLGYISLAFIATASFLSKDIDKVGKTD